MTSYECVCGEYRIERRAWVDKRLSEHPSSQCGVIVNKDGTHFISYVTHVITIDNDGWLSCTGTYSATTRKQIGWFLREYAPRLCYHDAKHCAEKGVEMNIHTREVRPA